MKITPFAAILFALTSCVASDTEPESVTARSEIPELVNPHLSASSSGNPVLSCTLRNNSNRIYYYHARGQSLLLGAERETPHGWEAAAMGGCATSDRSFALRPGESVEACAYLRIGPLDGRYRASAEVRETRVDAFTLTGWQEVHSHVTGNCLTGCCSDA